MQLDEEKTTESHQAVGPVQVWPPHCAHWTAKPVPVGVEAVDVVVLVTVVEIVVVGFAVVVAGGA